MTSPSRVDAPIQVPRKGLTKAGVVVLQTLFVALFTVSEISFRQGVGVFTGIAICVAVIGTVRFGRSGTAYVSAATTPLAFAASALLTILLEDGPHPSRIGVDFIASLASVAPYLLIAASYGWLNYLRSRRSNPTR